MNKKQEGFKMLCETPVIGNIALHNLVHARLLLLLVLSTRSVWSQFGGSRVQPSPGGSVGCPERNGRFPIPSQCDAYIECLDGVGEEKLCPDGLLFNSKSPFFTYPCQYPAEVDCEGRSGLQPAQPTEECPHQFGYYREGDAQNCGQFRNCANGRGYIFDCPEGLAFNEYTLRCDWPDQVDSCNAEAFLGFTCPNPGAENTVYGSEGYQFFRSPSNCQKYFVCIKGRPRLFSCGEGKAFNELINSCDGAENVTGCSYQADRQFGSSVPPPRQFNKSPQNTFGRPTPRPQYRPQRHDEYDSLHGNIIDPFVPNKNGPERLDLFSNNLLQNDFRSK